MAGWAARASLTLELSSAMSVVSLTKQEPRYEWSVKPAKVGHSYQPSNANARHVGLTRPSHQAHPHLPLHRIAAGSDTPQLVGEEVMVVVVEVVMALGRVAITRPTRR